MFEDGVLLETKEQIIGDILTFYKQLLAEHVDRLQGVDLHLMRRDNSLNAQ